MSSSVVMEGYRISSFIKENTMSGSYIRQKLTETPQGRLYMIVLKRQTCLINGDKHIQRNKRQCLQIKV